MLDSIRRRLELYGYFGFLRLFFDWLHTKIFFPGARLVRRKAYIRGRRKMRIGRGFTSGVGLRMDVFADGDEDVLVIGKNVQINDYVHIAASVGVTIGDDVLMASKVFISDHNHGNYRDRCEFSRPNVRPEDRPLFSRKVVIGARVWLGENVSVLPGVSIGDGAIVGTGSVVTSDIPEDSIAVGIPAKVVKKYDKNLDAWIPV